MPVVQDSKAIAQFNFRDNYTPIKELSKRITYCVRVFDDGTWEITNADGDGLEILQQGYWRVDK